MLRDWRERQTNLTEQAALKTALEQSGQIRLADDLFTFTEGDPTTPHKNNGDPEQDQDVTTPLMLLPNTTNSPSTATATPAAAAAAAAITTTITATSNTDVTSSTSNYPQKDFDDILEEVAKRVRKNLEIDKLGRKLGFSPEDIEGYNATNHKSQNITYDGTLQMLRDWRERQTNLTERAALKNALEQSGKNRLADDLFPSSQ
ncbi:uncharacterized protein LOC105445507 [Strongylocentrotus purpuratus]|uniref:Death domain-containing protein n=1 Tax=Strongylocentrotus purpuratus TaxID=7668 RepID=A0A7M7NF90_STRPU|nr:uncharacterized protein LOC105445507 [Strongylocentrotus purpuratus]